MIWATYPNEAQALAALAFQTESDRFYVEQTNGVWMLMLAKPAVPPWIDPASGGVTPTP